jgi:hypothetical protein
MIDTVALSILGFISIDIQDNVGTKREIIDGSFEELDSIHLYLDSFQFFGVVDLVVRIDPLIDKILIRVIDV